MRSRDSVYDLVTVIDTEKKTKSNVKLQKNI